MFSRQPQASVGLPPRSPECFSPSMPTLLWPGLLTGPLLPTVGLPDFKETFGQRWWPGQETKGLITSPEAAELLGFRRSHEKVEQELPPPPPPPIPRYF